MISKATPQFWQRYAALPTDILQLADKAYLLWQDDPGHGSLHSRNWTARSTLVGAHWAG